MPMQTKTLGHDGNSKGISTELRLKREFVAERYFSFWLCLLTLSMSQMLPQKVLFVLLEFFLT